MRVAPEAKPLLLPQKKAISSANPVGEKALTPTEIGQRIAGKLGLERVSARAANKKLLSLGYKFLLPESKNQREKKFTTITNRLKKVLMVITLNWK